MDAQALLGLLGHDGGAEGAAPGPLAAGGGAEGAAPGPLAAGAGDALRVLALVPRTRGSRRKMIGQNVHKTLRVCATQRQLKGLLQRATPAGPV
jgi:hypothetical protein